MPTPATMRDPAVVRRYVEAGKATVTISSARTGTRYTLRFTRTSGVPTDYFVSLLTGPDNESSYTYLGLYNSGAAAAGFNRPFGLTRRSYMQPGSPPVVAARYFCETVLRNGRMPAGLEVRHEGACGRCGRVLTVPDSIDRGIGPECWARVCAGETAKQAA